MIFGTPFALSAQARRKRFAWPVGALRCFNPESLSVRTLSSKQPVNILCFITMTLICLVKLNHIFHMVQVHSTELTRIPQALLSTDEIHITWLDYSRSCMKKLLNRRLVKFSSCVHYVSFGAWFLPRKYSLNAFGQNLHSPRSDMKNAAVPALMFPACAIRLSWMGCWISPKNHSLCNCNCHSFSLPIKRFPSPTGLVLQDSGCLHFKKSPLFICIFFKRRKGKKETKVLSAFQASRTVVRSKSRAIQNFDSPRSCMENAVGGSNTRTWKNGKRHQSCWLAQTRKPIPCWF